MNGVGFFPKLQRHHYTIYSLIYPLGPFKEKEFSTTKIKVLIMNELFVSLHIQLLLLDSFPHISITPPQLD